jgi:hypothetical protein
MSHPANLGQLIAHTAGEYHQYLIDIRWLRGILDLVAANSKTEGKSCRRGGAAASPFSATFSSVGGRSTIEGRMMKFTSRNKAERRLRLLSEALMIVALSAGSGYAQPPTGAGQISTPESSSEKPGDVGMRAHTNIEIFVPNRGPADAQPPAGNGNPGGTGYPSGAMPDTKGAGKSVPPQ